MSLLKSHAKIDVNLGAAHRPSMDFRLMQGVNGSVAAGAKVYFVLDPGRRYGGVWLFYAAAALALADMTFTWKADGKVFQTYTGDQRDAWNQHDGLAAAAANTGALYLPFERPRLADPRERLASAINVGVGPCQQSPNGLGEVRLEITIAAVTTCTVFDLYGCTSDINLEQSVWLPRIDIWQETPGVGAGQVLKQRLTTWGDHTRQKVTRLWLNDTAAHITRLRIEEGGDPAYDVPTALANIFVKKEGLRVPQASWQFWDGGMHGEGRREIKAYEVSALKVVIDTVAGVANPLTVVVESLGTTS